MTLDNYVENVKALEQLISEPKEVTEMLQLTAKAVENMAKNNEKICIKTDYDADGICSAYIMQHLIEAISPNCNVTVECNDRRNAYGLQANLEAAPNTAYIICDMGCNQLEYAREALGDNVIIIDHHLITDEEARQQFISNEGNNVNLCNPHCFHKDDTENSQYCATGLAYRVYQCVKESVQDKSIFPEKLDNTLAIMAGIGTAGDVVNVMDLHSYNRQIIKDCCQRIDNADESNIDFRLGYFLKRTGIPDEVTCHDVAFIPVAVLNCGGRMSEILNENGADMVYKALTAPECSDTFRKIEKLIELNSTRKDLINELTNSEEYKQFVFNERHGDNAKNNIAVYKLPDNTPAAFAGLVAGKLTEATNKAIICLTYSDERQGYTGSGRNTPTNATSLNSYVKYALGMDKDEKNDDGIQINYGGHENAIGVSYLDDIERFTEAIIKHCDAIEEKPLDSRNYIQMTVAESTSQETLDKLLMIQPTGMGNELPKIIIDGTETYREKGFIKDREDWKKITLKNAGEKTTITDFSYYPEAYPQSGKKNNEIVVLCDMSLSHYKGIHVDLQASHDRAFLSERNAEVEKEHSLKKSTGMGLG